MLPAKLIPPGFTWQSAKSAPISNAMLMATAGRATLSAFRHLGWVGGYHGWLTGKASASAPFATYDIYGFTTARGAQLGRLAYQESVLGTPLEYPNDALPKSALVWTDTGTFGANQTFYVAEIMFRVANVLADVTGFAIGADAQAANSALAEATAVTVACTSWLGARLPATQHRARALSLAPLLAAPAALGRIRRDKWKGRR
jgi:hypothetical protein